MVEASVEIFFLWYQNGDVFGSPALRAGAALMASIDMTTLELARVALDASGRSLRDVGGRGAGDR